MSRPIRDECFGCRYICEECPHGYGKSINLEEKLEQATRNIKCSIHTDKIRSGEKAQIIRPAEKYSNVKPGDMLVLLEEVVVKVGAHKREINKLYFVSHGDGYTFNSIQVKAHTRRIKKKIGTAIVSKVVPIMLEHWKSEPYGLKTGLAVVPYSINLGDMAKADGFDTFTEFANFFITTYNLRPGDSKNFAIIRWQDFKEA